MATLESRSATRDDPISCTVGVLTHNSGQSLRRALESVRDFGEIIICDGGSTDNTLAIAEEFDCTVIHQRPEYKEGTWLVNFSGVRNQILEGASYDWIFMLDSDEYCSEQIGQEIRAITAQRNPPTPVYMVPRRYVVGGRLIDCAITYPTRQLRLFNRQETGEYKGLLNEKLSFDSEVQPGLLSGEQYVPVPPLKELWQKWMGYRRLEERQWVHASVSEWRQQVVRPYMRLVRYHAWRYTKILRECKGERMPFRYEAARIASEALTIWYTGRKFLGFGRANSGRVWSDGSRRGHAIR